MKGMRVLAGLLLFLVWAVASPSDAAARQLHGSQCTPSIVVAGDSISRATTPTLLTSYAVLIGASIGATVYNESHDGIGWNLNPGGGNLTTLAATEIDPLRTSANCVPPFLILFAGTNDIFNGSTGAQTFSFFQTYITARQSAGWAANTKVVIATALIRAGDSNTERVAYNTALVNGAATFGYAVARLDLDANIGCSTCNTNPTYFQGDQIHPTQVGQQVIANIVCLAMGFSAGACPAY